MRIAYLFTTFPVFSETFLQREIREMRKLNTDIEIYSLHRGQDMFEGMPVHCFSKFELIQLIWALPYCLIRKPVTMLHLAESLIRNPMRCRINLAENLLGIAFALIYARRFKKNPPDLFHAVWATMPAAAAMLLREFTGIPFTMGAHAYDIYRCGGDWLMHDKIKTARMVHTTTLAAKQHLERYPFAKGKVTLIRRGLHPMPEMKPLRKQRKPLRLLSVGRAIEKKGYEELLDIYHYLKLKGFSFEARIVGGGRLEKRLEERIQILGLTKEVLLLGRLDFQSVLEQYSWADAFIFSGKVAKNGDRDGLPNVIPEAMAFGLPVLASPVSGTPEAIQHMQTGFLIAVDQHNFWLQALEDIATNDALCQHIRYQARDWVLQSFDARKNAGALANELFHNASLKEAQGNPRMV